MLARISLSTCRRYYSSKPKYNTELIQLLNSEVDEEMANSKPNAYRAKSLKNAISIINKLDFEITDPDAMKNMSGIGRGVTRRIREHLLDNLPGSVSTQRAYVLELESIPGIGRKRAEKLVNEGCLGLAGVREEKFWNTLSEGQQASIRLGGHNNNATLQEAETVTEFIRNYVSSKYEVVAVGDCRRRAPEMETISVMLLDPHQSSVPLPRHPKKGSYHPAAKAVSTIKEQKATTLHSTIIPALKDRGLLVGGLNQALTQWTGVIIVPEKDQNVDGKWSTRRQLSNATKDGTGKFRKLTLSMVPKKSEGSALIHRTGDEGFKRHVMQKADRLGLFFNELGLWKWHPDKDELDSQSSSNTEDTLSAGIWHMLNSATERSVFEQLGMAYVEPERRNLSKLYPKK